MTPGLIIFTLAMKQELPEAFLPFSPWEGIEKEHTGTGMATDIGYSVPEDSLEFWRERFKQFEVKHQEVAERFGEKYLSFQDQDGFKIDFIVSNVEDNRKHWETNEIKSAVATKGFHNTTLTLKNVTPTATILTGIMGYQLQKQEGNRYRFVTDAIDNASIVDIIEAPNLAPGLNAPEPNRHVAFRVKDDTILMDYREKIESKGLTITPKIDRDYFFSLYFLEHGGVLFELATDNPGFSKNEPISEWGNHLKLPAQYEGTRAEIEKALSKLD